MPMSTARPVAPGPPSTAGGVGAAPAFSTTVPSTVPSAIQAISSRPPSVALTAASVTAGPLEIFTGGVHAPPDMRDRKTCGTPPSRLM